MVEIRELDKMSTEEAVQELVEHAILLEGRYENAIPREEYERLVDNSDFNQNAYVADLSKAFICFCYRLGGKGVHLFYLTPYTERRINLLHKVGFIHIGKMMSPIGNLPVDDKLRSYWRKLVASDVDYMESVYTMQAKERGRFLLTDEQITKCFRISDIVKSDCNVEYWERFGKLDTDELGTWCQSCDVMVIRNANGRLYITTDEGVKAAIKAQYAFYPQSVPFVFDSPKDPLILQEFNKVIKRPLNEA